MQAHKDGCTVIETDDKGCAFRGVSARYSQVRNVSRMVTALKFPVHSKLSESQWADGGTGYPLGYFTEGDSTDPVLCCPTGEQLGSARQGICTVCHTQLLCHPALPQKECGQCPPAGSTLVQYWWS